MKALVRSTVGRWLRPASKGRRGPMDGFMDSLVQTFENCRHGLPDRALEAGTDEVERYFLAIHEKETPRLRDVVKQHVPLESADGLWREIDELVRTVVVPGYARLATRYTPRERRDFFLGERFHGLERLLWGVAGILLGAFVIWAPFIPLWSKEWVLPFMIAGLLFPELRRFLAVHEYESRLNLLVERADREVARLDFAYLLSPGRVAPEERHETRPPTAAEVDTDEAPRPRRQKER